VTVTTRAGRADWSWTIPDDAPSGSWEISLRCGFRGRSVLSRFPVEVETASELAYGPLLILSTLRVRGARGFSCRLDGSSNYYCAKQCTWFVKDQYPEVPNGWGNAYAWDNRARGDGWTVSAVPRAGAIAVWEPWAGVWTGHVAIVKRLLARQGEIRVRERGWAAAGRYGEHTTPVGGAGEPTSFICPPGRCRSHRKTGRQS
jgi:CHAP domain